MKSLFNKIYNSLWAFILPALVDSFAGLIREYVSSRGAFSFIQIGSHDGVTDDLLHKFIISGRARGVLVEPVPYLFERLKTTYRDLGSLYFDNVAISVNDGEKDFYMIKESADPAVPSWHTQLGSFSLPTIMKHSSYIPGLEKLIEKKRIRTKSFKSLAKKHGMTSVDILQIDTEGHDREIIKSIDFEKFSAEILIFEYRHMRRADYLSCLRLLNRYYSNLRRSPDYDTMCFDRRHMPLGKWSLKALIYPLI